MARRLAGSPSSRGMIQGTAPAATSTRTYCWLITQQRGNWSGISSRVCVGMPMIGRLAIPTPRRRPYTPESTPERPGRFHGIYYPFGRLSDDRVYHGLEIAGLTVPRQLPVGAGSVLQDMKGVLHFRTAAQLVQH